MNRGLRPPFQMAEQYVGQHRGTAIICGSAPCVFSDLEKAKSLFPDADILGVNNTAAMIDEIEHVWTQHAEHAKKFKEAVTRKIYIHSKPRHYRNGGGMWLLPVADYLWEKVDYQWPDLHWVSGSSGVAGALWAKHGLGYEMVVMCGIPLDPDSVKYTDKYPSEPTKQNGDFAEKRQLVKWAQTFEQYVNDGRASNIYSMSGKTNEITGNPPC